MNPARPQPSTRRDFLRQAGCAALGSTSLYSILLNLAMTGRAAAESLPLANAADRVPYKALVCLFLDGGNDSFNMLVPGEAGEFSRYSAARGNLALSADTLLEITQPTGDSAGRRFGLHAGMPEFQRLYAEGKLSFVANVGTLVERTSVAAINSYTAKLPLGLYSHSDQAMHWQTATPDRRGSIGWGGRAAEILQSLNEKNEISMNISLGGTNLFQSGPNLIPYAITPDGAPQLQSYQDPAKAYFHRAVDSMLEQNYQNLLKSTYARFTRNAIDSSEIFLRAWEQTPRLTTPFPNSELGHRLRGTAQAMAVRDRLGMNRQIYFVRYGGWDHHDEVLKSQAAKLEQVSQAIGAFWQALGEMGLQDDVVLFSASDFGRTLSSNGEGSDHGWGGNQFVLGGGHRGGRIYGHYPENLTLGNDLDTGRGRLIPTTSVDEYFGELALWLGVSRSDLPTTLPNIERFFDLAGASTPLGMWG